MVKVRNDIEENKITGYENYGNLPASVLEQLEWFRNQKIGVIFHWGLYSQAGIVESWQLSKEDTWARTTPFRADLATLREDYWNLYKSFNPIRFDPADWAAQCKEAGFRYMIFTTKHHDGFNMYNTQESDFKVTDPACPYHVNSMADIFGAVVEAFRQEDIGIGAYYSKADWHCPYYWVPGENPIGRYASYDPVKNPMMWAKFNQFVTNQLTELCTNYGAIDILWLDGGWVNADNHEFLDMRTISQRVRENQPGMLIVDRTIGGEFENYVTPERKIPSIPPKKAWESNIPLANNWGYVPGDVYKPFSEIIESIVKIVSLGGNVLLGIGPKPDGTLPEQARLLMKELGAWMQIYGDGIYDTRPFAITEKDKWHFTQKPGYIYAFHAVTKGGQISLNLDDLVLTDTIQSIINMKNNEHLEVNQDQVIIDVTPDDVMIGIKISFAI